MASTKQMQERARAARKAAKGKTPHQAVYNLGRAAGYSEEQMKSLRIFTPGELIDFTNIDVGYEPFIEALRGMGFDWQEYRTKGGSVDIVFVAGERNMIPHHAGDFPATETCENGTPLCEFAVGAGYFTVLEAIIDNLQQQVAKKLCIPMLHYNKAQHKLVATIMAA